METAFNAPRIWIFVFPRGHKLTPSVTILCIVHYKKMLERWWQSIQEIKYSLINRLLFIALVMLLLTPVAHSMCVLLI